MAQAPAADQVRLLTVQDVDTRVQQARHRLETLPARSELAALEATAADLRAARIEAETAVSDIKREVTKAEDDVQSVRARSERDNARLLDGGMTPRELQGLQSELEVLAKRQADLEEVELEAMQRLEDAEKTLADVSARLIEVDSSRTEVATRLDHESAAIEAEVASLLAERASIADTIDANLMALYEKLREQHGGVGAAPLARGACQGCHMNLNPGDLAAIESRPPDHVVRCEECGRILVRGAST